MNWKTVALGDVCSIVNGGTPKSEVAEYWDGDLNWITPKEMGKLLSRDILSTERKITDKGLKNSSAKLLPINSVILSSRAPIGHLAINKSLMATNQGCKGIVPSEVLNYEYLYYFLSHSKQLLNDMGSGATFKELSGSKLATVEIPLPPLSTQQKIVAKLDEIFAEIDKATAANEANAKNSEALFESVLRQAYQIKDGHKTVELGDICDITGGGTPSKSNHNFYTGDIPWATVRDMNKDYLEETDFKINKEAVKESSTNIIPKNNVVIATRVGLGKVCILKQDTAINQDLRGIVPKNPKALDVNYLFFWFKSISKVIVDAGRGATVHGVTLPFIKSLQIPLPPIALQEEIVAKLDVISEEVKKSTKSYTDKISELATLKQSILKQAFNGELVKE